MSYNTKNRIEQGGNKTVIEGVLEFTNDSQVDGIPIEDLIPVADADTLGGITVGNGLDITEDGTLSAEPLGGVSVGAGLSLSEYDGKLWAVINRQTDHVADASGNKGDVYWTLLQILQNMKNTGQMLSDPYQGGA